jgi:outer membrane protein assembly factor BamE
MDLPRVPKARMVLPMLIACLSVAACTGTIVSYTNPYRIDVRQGNYVTQEMVARLKLGMTRDQVRFVLGTPLVNDVFHADRWDYVYRFQPGRGELQQRRVSVFFADGKLARVAGDVVPADAAGAQEPAAGPAVAPDSAAVRP